MFLQQDPHQNLFQIPRPFQQRNKKSNRCYLQNSLKPPIQSGWREVERHLEVGVSRETRSTDSNAAGKERSPADELNPTPPDSSWGGSCIGWQNGQTGKIQDPGLGFTVFSSNLCK